MTQFELKRNRVLASKKSTQVGAKILKHDKIIHDKI